MKKIKIMMLIVALILIALPTIVFAAGSITPSTRSLSITKGSTKTFQVTASNACGRVDISSSNTSVAKVDVSSQWLENNSVTVNVTGVSAGTTTITVKLSDAATFDEEELTGSYTITVNVEEPRQDNNNQSNNNSQGNNNTPSNNNSQGNNTNKVPTTNPQLPNNNNLSRNNNIKALSVEGYDLIDTGNNTYELLVNNNVTYITINGEAEDSKAQINGIGNKEVAVGKNEFVVTVISEAGTKNDYKINVTRKDGFYLEDINALLSDKANENKEIIIKKDNSITIDNLNVVKSNKEKISFNYYNENKKILYSWGLDGNLIQEPIAFNTNLNFYSEYVEEIGKISNYADGLYLNFEHNGELPKGTKIKVFVGEKFKNEDNVNVYYHNKENNSLDSISKNLTVVDGYIEFEIEHCSDYFVTRSEVKGIIEETKKIDIFFIIAIIEFIIIIVFIVIGYLKIKSMHKVNKDI